jgi:deoxyadenosine kinase
MAAEAPLFISISGIIGAGKTTLATSLGEAFSLPSHYEPVVENEYLADFYADMGRHSFALQIYLLNKRFAQHQAIIWSGKGGVQDRTIYEDSVFAGLLQKSGKMSERDYRTYVELFKNMSNFMRKPNLIVHLDVTPEESLARIHARARNCETGISIEYLRSLHAAYEVYLEDIARVVPVIRVNWSAYKDPVELSKSIKKEWESMQNVRRI